MRCTEGSYIETEKFIRPLDEDFFLYKKIIAPLLASPPSTPLNYTKGWNGPPPEEQNWAGKDEMKLLLAVAEGH